MKRLAPLVCLLLVGCASPFPVEPKGEIDSGFVPLSHPLGKVDNLWVKSSFKSPATGQSVIFGQVGQCNPIGCRPALFVEEGGKWTIHDFADERFYHLGWVFVATDTERRRYWGILDGQVEGPAWALRVVVSLDGGRTWRVGEPVRKPYYLGDFHSFEMTPDGKATLEIAFDEDAGTAVPKGFYVYESGDAGLTWKPKAFRPNLAWGYREPAHEGLVPLKERISAGRAH